MIGCFLALFLMLICLLSVLEGILGVIVSVIVALIFVIWVICNWQDVLDFIIALLPLLICGGFFAGILYLLFRILY